MSTYYFAVCDNCKAAVFANSTRRGLLEPTAIHFLVAHFGHEPRIVDESTNLQHSYCRWDKDGWEKMYAIEASWVNYARDLFKELETK